MINFFRKLRRKGMKGTHYLKYAIGEIFLVVIGILIALSLNNYNQAKNDRQFEIKMLQEVSQALKDDIVTFKRFDKAMNNWQNSMNILINEMQSANELKNDLDSMSYHLDVIHDIGLYAIYNDGPYEAIKSSGLNLISNHQIRAELAEIYSKDLPALDIWINEIVRELIWKKYEVMDNLFDFEMTFEDRPKSRIILVNSEFLNNNKLRSAIRKLYSGMYTTTARMKSAATKMESLKERIDTELK